MRLVTLPGVFTPISDSWMLADALRSEILPPGARVLDLCTGSGVLALTAAQRGAEATAVDLSRRALWTVRINALRNRLRVRTLRGDLFGAVKGELFDCIVSNPPYVPCEADSLPSRGPERAWKGGRDGRLLLDRICREAAAHLRPGGVVLLTHSTIIGEQRTLELLRDAGLEASVIARRRGPLGPLMCAQVKRGILPATTDDEEVVIVRGKRMAAKSGNNASEALATHAAPGVGFISTRS